MPQRRHASTRGSTDRAQRARQATWTWAESPRHAQGVINSPSSERQMRQAAPCTVGAWGLPLSGGAASSCLQEVCGDDVGVGWLRRRRKMPIFGAFWAVLQKAQPLNLLLSQRFNEARFPIGVLAESSVTEVLCCVGLC